MARLPADKRERIQALLLEGLSPVEVAEKVGISVATAERYHRYWLPEIRETVDRKMVLTLKAAIKAAKKR